MLSVALFSSVENIKKLLFTASFGRVLNYLSLSSSPSYFSSPNPLSRAPSCLSPEAAGAPRLCCREASPAVAVQKAASRSCSNPAFPFPGQGLELQCCFL